VKPEPSYSSKVTSSGSHSVMTEPSSQPNSSITPGEPSAYRPAQELRDQIAMLNAKPSGSGSQASIRVKQEPFAQIEPQLSISDAMRSRSEAYDAPVTEAGIGHTNSPPMGVKQEPQDVQSDASVAWPSKVLWDVWARYQSRQQGRGDPAGPIKQEPHTLSPSAAKPTTQSTGTTSSIGSIPRGPLPPFKTKRDPEASEDVQPWKRPKTEIN